MFASNTNISAKQMKLKKLAAAAASALMIASMSTTAISPMAYVRYDGTPPDPTGKTLTVHYKNVSESIDISGVVADGAFDDMTDLYGLTFADGTIVTEENYRQAVETDHQHDPRFKWGDWDYGVYELTCSYDDGSQNAVWEYGVTRMIPDFPIEKEITDCGYYLNYGTDDAAKFSNRNEYGYYKQEDGSYKWTNGIFNYPELDVPYTVLATKMECVCYVKNDAQPIPLDPHVYKSIVEQDLYLSSFRTFANAYALTYEGEFAYPTLSEFSQTGLDESYKHDVIHYRLIDFYDTFIYEDGVITFDDLGHVKHRFIERSGQIVPNGIGGLTLVNDETPIKRDYFWPQEICYYNDPHPVLKEPDTTTSMMQPATSGIISRSDVTGDGEVNVTDIIKLQKYLLKQDTFTFENYINSDLNEDGVVNIFDLALLKRQLINVRNNG